ncbi:MAG: glycosyltransferase [Candidatus Woesebacteria bacterium]|jgi:hypothetical protein
MKKTAAVYDRWFYTLGGGEQVAFAFAEIFKEMGFKTDILTHKKLDLKLAKQKLGSKLGKMQIRYLPNLPDYKLSKYTEEYDIFANHSYLDYIPNRSNYGLKYVSFPSKVNVSIYELLKRAHIVPSLRKFFIYPSQFEGFRYDSFERGKLHKWLGKKSSITFNENIKNLELEFKFESLAFSCLDQIKFYLNKKMIDPAERTVDQYNNTVKYTFKFKKEIKNLPLTIETPDSEFSYGVSLTRIWIKHYRYFFYNLFKRYFPKWEMRLHGGPSMTRLSDIESYEQVLCNSKFTKKWIKNYWGLKSTVLYPPVNVQMFKAAKHKKNIIINVGRFFVGGHCKKQLDMARVFKRLVDEGVTNWELHFVGGVAEGKIHQQYLNSVKQESAGYPVFFHIDSPLKELRKLLSLAKIYWHATGLDEDEKRAPILMEHFGISTVEAMAAGCVPVAINKGGQPEIITEVFCGPPEKN